MGDISKHTSMSPDVYRLLDHFSLPYHNSSWNLRRNPALLAHKISSQQFPNPSPASSAVSPNTHSHPRKQNHVSVLAGLIRCATRVAALTAVAPIERVCILMQCQNEMIKYGHLSSPYKGMKDCLLRTIKHEGVLSLWRGNNVHVISTLTSFLTANVIFQISPPSWVIPLCMMSQSVFFPLEYARTRLANDVKATRELQFSLDSARRSFSTDGIGSRKFSGAFDVFNKTLKLEGVSGLYRGCIPTCLASGASQLCLLWSASVSKQNKMTVRRLQEKHNWSYKIITIAMSIVGITVLRYPFVTVSRRMMMTTGEKTKYKGAMDAVRQIVKHEGVSSLYKGVTPFIIHMSSALFTYVYLTNFLHKMLK